MENFIMGFITILGGVFTGVIGFALIGGLIALMVVPTIGLYRRSHKPHAHRRLPGAGNDDIVDSVDDVGAGLHSTV